MREAIRRQHLNRCLVGGCRIVGRQRELEGALCYMGACITGFTRGYAAQMERTRAERRRDRPFPSPRPLRFLSWEEVKRLHGLSADPADWPAERPRVNLKPGQEEV